jgi:hypothetical protein
MKIAAPVEVAIIKRSILWLLLQLNKALKPKRIFF